MSSVSKNDRRILYTKNRFILLFLNYEENFFVIILLNAVSFPAL